MVSLEVEIGVVLAEIHLGCQHTQIAHFSLTLLTQSHEQVAYTRLKN